MIAHLLEIRIGDGTGRAVGREAGWADELLRVRDGQRAEHQGIYQAEDSAVGADAERERQHRDGKERGTAAQCARSVPEVLREIGEPSAPHVAYLFSDLLQAAKFKPGAAARFGFVEAGGYILSDHTVEVVTDLLIDLRI
jgi:hypothetical protein